METIIQQPKNNKSSYKKWFRILGWFCFILGYFFLLGLLSGLPDAEPSFPLWLIGLFPLGFIFLFIGFKKILNKIIIVCVFILLVVMFFSVAPHGKARDSSIRATLASMRSEAELHVTGEGDNWNYSADLCDQNSGSMSALFKGLISIKARDTQCFVSSDLKSWAVSTKLRDSDDIYCSDSTGFSGKITVNITSSSCASIKTGDNGQ